MELSSAESQSESRAFTERPYLNSNEEEYFFSSPPPDVSLLQFSSFFSDSLSVSQAAVPSLGQ